MSYEQRVIVLNDQGGAVMNVSYDVSGTLRAQEHGHPPLILEETSKDGTPRIYDTGVVPTLRTNGGGQRIPCVLRGCSDRDDINEEHDSDE